MFSVFGGIASSSAVREGKLRAQGPFEVYITAGVFGATLLPLFAWLWKAGSDRLYAFVGLVSATVITVTSNSSTPLLAYTAGIVGLAFWPLRGRMRAFRWGLVFTLVGLHLVMKAPVWALIARIDLTGSSSGYHRFMLVDNCIRHFGEWWLIGVKDYDSWGWDMWDLSNQYVAYAVTGGLVTLRFLHCDDLAELWATWDQKKMGAGDRRQEWFFWCLELSPVRSCGRLFRYWDFDQMQAAWYTLLAIICAASAESPSDAGPADELLLSGSQSGIVIDGWAWEVDR